MGALLVATISLTVFDLPWIAFLTGILCTAVVGLVSRHAYAATALAEAREYARYVDVDLPTMILYVSADGVVRYHNQALRSRLRAREAAINGHSLRDAVGLTIFAHMKDGLEAALAGRARHETYTLEGVGGPDTRLFTQYLPHFGKRDEVVGAFILQTDVTALEEEDALARRGCAAAAPPLPAATAAVAMPAAAPDASQPSSPAREAGETERGIFVQTMTEELTDWRNAGDRLRAAIDNNEFCLYAQAIAPVTGTAPLEPFYEMLLRLREEEEGLMPPGAFIPLAEEYGLMPDLDRWVVRNVLDWACAKPERQAGMYSINVAPATIGNPEFPDYVTAEIRRRGVPGSLLCFEVLEEDVVTRRTDAARLVSVLAEAGCRTALCGFGQNAVDYGLLESLKVDFLKIDGDIVLGLNRNSIALIKLKAICRVAQATKRRTIAEFVEDNETMVKLREHGVDYAQGFGVGRPRPLANIG
jgi:EAL domain-containing protein (putative c-di-GMP-specific phosphodiesterase class I)